MRANAAWALGRIGNPTAAKAVEGTLQDKEPAVRAAGATALGRLESRASIEILLRVLKSDESPEVRRVAAWALGQIDDRSAAPGLAAALKSDTQLEVREMAAWALAELGARDSVDALAGALRSDQSAEVRETAAWALGELDARTAEAALAAALGDREASVRATAAGAGQIGHDRAPAAPVAALKDADDEVRSGRLGPERDRRRPADASGAADARRDKEKVRQVEVRALLHSAIPGGLVAHRVQGRQDARNAVQPRGRNAPRPWLLAGTLLPPDAAKQRRGRAENGEDVQEQKHRTCERRVHLARSERGAGCAPAPVLNYIAG